MMKYIGIYNPCYHRILDNRKLISPHVYSPEVTTVLIFFCHKRLVLLVLEYNINEIIQHEISYIKLLSLRMKVGVKSLSRVQLFATLWNCQAPPSLGFSRQEYWSGLTFSSPGDLLDPGTEFRSPTLQANSLPSEP